MSTFIKSIKGRYEESQNPNFTPKFGESNISINRFMGGKDGMIQITISNNAGISYTQLTKKQAKELALVLNDSFDYYKYPSE